MQNILWTENPKYYIKKDDEDEHDDELDPDDEDVVDRHATCIFHSAPNFLMKYRAALPRSS